MKLEPKYFIPIIGFYLFSVKDDWQFDGWTDNKWGYSFWFNLMMFYHSIYYVIPLIYFQQK